MTETIIPANDPTPDAPVILRVHFFADDFMEVRRIHNKSKNPLIADFFYGVEVGFGEHDIENLFDKIGEVLDMPLAKRTTVLEIIREYTRPKFKPEPAPF